ncbi:MAG: hypothetical protein J3Q66DRAFT_374844 [Benniella sp.]|nr:MAG: hypothetical protein J3Q66DRAFT_374844 [Benniella sp.]
MASGLRWAVVRIYILALSFIAGLATICLPALIDCIWSSILPVIVWWPHLEGIPTEARAHRYSDPDGPAERARRAREYLLGRMDKYDIWLELPVYLTFIFRSRCRCHCPSAHETGRRLTFCWQSRSSATEEQVKLATDLRQQRRGFPVRLGVEPGERGKKIVWRRQAVCVDPTYHLDEILQCPLDGPASALSRLEQRWRASLNTILSLYSQAHL